MNTSGVRRNEDSRLCLVRPKIKEIEVLISDGEWEGLAPEKLMHLISELEYLRMLEDSGESYVPNF